MATLLSMNGADPITPEELGRIIGAALTDSHTEEDPALADDFGVLCRLLASGQLPIGDLSRYPQR